VTASAEEVREALSSFDSVLNDPAFWKLSDRPSPMDIACELCRAMEIGRFEKRGKTFVQTVYTVLVSPLDWERFDKRNRELVATLEDTIAWWARSHEYNAPGDLRVRLAADESLEAGQLSIEAGLRPEEAAKLGRMRHSE